MSDNTGSADGDHYDMLNKQSPTSVGLHCAQWQQARQLGPASTKLAAHLTFDSLCPLPAGRVAVELHACT